VHTLEDFRRVIKEQAHSKFLTLQVSDNVTMTTDNLLVVLPMDNVVAEEPQLAHEYHYVISPAVQEVIKSRAGLLH
jgi:hypothetical protein